MLAHEEVLEGPFVSGVRGVCNLGELLLETVTEPAVVDPEDRHVSIRMRAKYGKLSHVMVVSSP